MTGGRLVILIIRPLLGIAFFVSGLAQAELSDSERPEGHAQSSMGQALAYDVVDAAKSGGLLKHNPFKRAFEKKPVNNGYGPNNNEIANGAMELKAVLYDEHQPMVNVSGRILMIGEQFDGYTLKEVNRETAILYKQGRATLLQLQADDTSDPLFAGDDGF